MEHIRKSRSIKRKRENALRLAVGDGREPARTGRDHEEGGKTRGDDGESERTEVFAPAAIYEFARHVPGTEQQAFQQRENALVDVEQRVNQVVADADERQAVRRGFLSALAAECLTVGERGITVATVAGNNDGLNR